MTIEARLDLMNAKELDGARLIGKGFHSLCYLLQSGDVLKVFYRFTDVLGLFSEDARYDRAQNEFDRMKVLHDSGIRVPQPFGLVDVILDEKTLPKDKLTYPTRGTVPHMKSECAKNYVGVPLPAIRRQFIPGKTLYSRLFPSEGIMGQLLDIQRKIQDAGFVNINTQTENYVVDPRGDVYLISCGELRPLTGPGADYNRFLGGRVKFATCKFGEWLNVLKENMELWRDNPEAML